MATTSTVIGLLVGVLAMASMATAELRWLPGNSTNLTIIHEALPECPPAGTEVNATTLANRYNCSQYYLCESGTPFLRDCPRGLQFNDLVGVCDFPWATTCHEIVAVVPAQAELLVDRAISPLCRGGDPPACPPPPIVGNVTTCPDIYNCSQYWFCDNGAVKLTSCPPPLQYSVAIGNCDYDWAANCVEATTTSTTTKPTTTTKQAPVAAVSEYCVVGGPPKCPPPTVFGNATFCPDTTNCSNYYICDNSGARHRSCAPGLEFNANINSCDFPWSANCVVTTSATTIATTTTKKPAPVAAVSEYCVVGGPPKCPPPTVFGNATFCPDTTNCTNYYICDNSGSQHRSCAPGLEFNANINSCDFPWSANCVVTTSATTIATTTTKKPAPEAAVSEYCVVGGPPKCPPPTVFGNATFCPDTTNCTNYYICDNSGSRHRSCAPGLEFNANINSCDFPWSANCVVTTSATTIATTTTKKPAPVAAVSEYCVVGGPPKCPPPTVFGNATFCPDTTNCTNYYICDNSGSQHRSCAPGLEFNANINSCDFPWSANCVVTTSATTIATTTTKKPTPVAAVSEYCVVGGPPKCPPPSVGGNATFCPDTTNCTNYYICDNSGARHRSCAPGLEFNANVNTCDFPWSANCVVSQDSLIIDSHVLPRDSIIDRIRNKISLLWRGV